LKGVPLVKKIVAQCAAKLFDDENILHVVGKKVASLFQVEIKRVHQFHLASKILKEFGLYLICQSL
jgi:hypothetical protein